MNSLIRHSHYIKLSHKILLQQSSIHNNQRCFLQISYRAFSQQLSKPSIEINFGKDKKFHIYHSEGGERFLSNITRIDMLFIFGNSLLLLLEIISPFFGYWHGISLSLTLASAFFGTYLLNYYSRRMIQDIYLLPDGRHVEVQYFNAFWVPKKQTLRILNIGYLQPSRLFNVLMATYQQKQNIYINLSRNLYKNPQYEEMIKQLLSGREFNFAPTTSPDTKKVIQTDDNKSKYAKPRKQKKYN